MCSIESAFCAGYAANENGGIPQFFFGGLQASAKYVSNLQFWQPVSKPSYCKCFHLNCPLDTCRVSTLSMYNYRYDQATTMRKSAEKYAELIETRKFSEIFKQDYELEECVNSIIGNE
jgi:hypothetical protein